MCVWRLRPESNITPRFLAVEVTFVDKGQKLFLMGMREFGGLNSMTSDFESGRAEAYEQKIKVDLKLNPVEHHRQSEF